MRFWDPSAIIPLLREENTSRSARSIHSDDGRMFVWWGAELECVSAVARVERTGADPEEISESLQRLDAFASGWDEVGPGATVRRSARRLLRTHDLRVADALQLAAALQASEGIPSMLDFVSQDSRLNDAARREGFIVVDPRAV
ncbi:MAG: PIN domain-containing protein [Actinomycetota bacterium]